MRTVTVLLAVLLASQPAAAETIVTVDLVHVIGDDVTLMLVTEYGDQIQYEEREANFRPIIEAAGGRKLLNDLSPGEFREITDALTFNTLE